MNIPIAIGRIAMGAIAASLLAAASAPAAAVQAVHRRLRGQCHGHAGQRPHVDHRAGQQSLAIHPDDQEFAGGPEPDRPCSTSRTAWLRPLSSTDLSRLLVKKKAVNTNFDWGKNQATWSGDVKAGRAGPVALQAGDMDALLVNLAIVRDVAAGKPLTTAWSRTAAPSR